MRIWLLTFSLLAAAAGCDSFLGPGGQRAVGIIEGLEDGAPRIEVPATVGAGQDFTVAVHTLWHNGCARKGETAVEYDGASATVTPYDVVTEGEVCTQAVQQFTHTATLRFSQPGTARVHVRGRASRTEGVTIITREVTVQ